MIKRIAWILAAVVGIAAYALVSTSDYGIAKAEHNHYCRDVELYRATDGVYGHPDYDKRDCSGYGDTAAGGE